MNDLATTLVIIGVTGDLSRRKLLPAIEQIAAADGLPSTFKIIGISRRNVTVQDVVDATVSPFVANHLEIFTMDLEKASEYIRFKEHLSAVEGGHATQRLYYLSLPPDVSSPIIAHLGESGLADVPQTKLLLEKPFGVDLDAAKAMVSHIKQYFDEESVYRIDHFLAKEMAQNIVVFRSGNSLFKRTWNRNFISAIDIVASESLDIEGRVGFYEQTGALRDIVQSHLMQLAALVLMELPQIGHWQDIPEKRLKAMQQLRAADPSESYRAQYSGYKDEVKNPNSLVETFADVTLYSDDPLWSDVPIRLTTGKALAEKSTEIKIHYTQHDDDREANQLILKIQPDERISLSLWTKKPGYDHEPQLTPMHFVYAEHFEALPEAYEKVFIDAMRGDHSLFTNSQEVIESWRVLQPVLDSWQQQKSIDTYPKNVRLDTLI